MPRRRLARFASVGIVLIFLVLLPVLTQNPYYLSVLIAIGTQIVLVAGLRLMMSTGQVSLAHGAFMGVGAYASALLVMMTGTPFWLALPAAGVVTGAFAVAVGYPILRVKGVYFFMVTFALGEVLNLIWVRWKALFGGSAGLVRIPAPNAIPVPGLGTITFNSKIPYYYLMLAILLVTLLVVYSLSRSRIGKIFHSVRDADNLAEGIGIDIMGYKVLAFAVAGFFAGVAGSFYAHYAYYISPDDFTFTVSMYAVIYAVIGGAAPVIGPVLGCGVLMGLSEALRRFAEYIPLIYGAILVAVAMLFPAGLHGMAEQVYLRLKLNRFFS